MKICKIHSHKKQKYFCSICQQGFCSKCLIGHLLSKQLHNEEQNEDFIINVEETIQKNSINLREIKSKIAQFTDQANISKQLQKQISEAIEAILNQDQGQIKELLDAQQERISKQANIEKLTDNIKDLEEKLHTHESFIDQDKPFDNNLQNIQNQIEEQFIEINTLLSNQALLKHLDSQKIEDPVKDLIISILNPPSSSKQTLKKQRQILRQYSQDTLLSQGKEFGQSVNDNIIKDAMIDKQQKLIMDLESFLIEESEEEKEEEQVNNQFKADTSEQELIQKDNDSSSLINEKDIVQDIDSVKFWISNLIFLLQKNDLIGFIQYIKDHAQLTKSTKKSLMQNLLKLYKDETDAETLQQDNQLLSSLYQAIFTDEFNDIDYIRNNAEIFSDKISQTLNNISHQVILTDDKCVVKQIFGEDNSTQRLILIEFQDQKEDELASRDVEKEVAPIVLTTSTEVQTENTNNFSFDQEEVPRPRTTLYKDTMIMNVCLLCQKDILLTDEYITILDCQHTYHRICMIHRLASATDKKFFITPDEIESKPSLHMCFQCEQKDKSKQFGRYRQHILFDLLKEKGQPFYQKMTDRQKLQQSSQQLISPKVFNSQKAPLTKSPYQNYHSLKNNGKVNEFNLEDDKIASNRSLLLNASSANLNDEKLLLKQQSKPKRDMNFSQLSCNSALSQNNVNQINQSEPSSSVKQNQKDHIVCEICQENKGLDLARYILAKTDNKIIQCSKTKKQVILFFPSCSCGFKELDIKDLIILFGKTKIKSVMWNLMKKSEIQKCQNCKNQNDVIKKQLDCQHALCNQCYNPEECQVCIKNLTKIKSSPTKLRGKDNNIFKYNTNDKRQSEQHQSSLIEQFKNERQEQHNSSSDIDSEEQFERCECEMTSNYLRSNYQQRNSIQSQKSVRRDKNSINILKICNFCQLPISDQKQKQIASIMGIQHQHNQSFSSQSKSSQNDFDKNSQNENNHEEELIFIPSKCVVCSQLKPSKKIATGCEHYVCRHCIRQAVLDPLVQDILNRKKIGLQKITCPQNECQQLIKKPMITNLTLALVQESMHPGVIDKLDSLYEPSLCCNKNIDVSQDEIGQIMSFQDQTKWISTCLNCKEKSCLVCSATLQECECKRCGECHSANLVKRVSTKSYFCTMCNKHYCEQCDNLINSCKCYSSSNDILGGTTRVKKTPNNQEKRHQTLKNVDLQKSLLLQNISHIPPQLNSSYDDFVGHSDYENLNNGNSYGGFFSSMLDKAFGSYK